MNAKTTTQPPSEMPQGALLPATALPWKATQDAFPVAIYAEGYRIATLTGGETVRNRKNADFIVHCVNNAASLASLTAKLAEAEAALTKLEHICSGNPVALQIIRAILTK
jgi:hypothetical protein